MSNINNINYVLENISRDDTAEHMAELLIDDECSTYKMFEELACLYLNGSDEVKKTIDNTCAIMTGWYFTSIAEQIKNKFNN